MKRFPVIEVFGPTIQGEGSEAGFPCYFVRFGGCDFHCRWCDSLYAVEPDEVRRNSTRMSAGDIVEKIEALPGEARWVILSGGNPVLHDLGELVAELQERGYLVAVETQGSKWKDWLLSVDRLTVSPKPPSSGETSELRLASFKRFMGNMADGCALAHVTIKIVVDDDGDLLWARRIFGMYPAGDHCLSVCTPQGDMVELDRLMEVTRRYRRLAEQVAADPDLNEVRVLPQLHVIAWGSRRGV